ncbi:hypothetical protein [Amycolatopsis echigonensis]|uniref:Excreted virulence factor EspC (Type VII ESX diderm) n=1 Tax=Amycolatopsis echigonensis TaxID=2576905 RepID=A0A2N3WDN0_9PSEU|nr:MULTISPECIES: hypothetical protein [Amycolatopsis]MBB2501033.1 hypothetical protein [Amycolatopsis echigonensis]PKV92006.1 hypothetical protein ATK30_2794 [Amycolatopsis niigatensis]
MSGIEVNAEPISGSSSAADTAGNAFLAGLTEGPGSHEAALKIREAGNTLKALAQSGAFAVNEAGFNAYLKACNFFLDGYRDMRYDLNILTQTAQMGSSDYANKVAKFNTTVAEGDTSAMLPNLDLMYNGVKAALDALTIARENYKKNESENTTSFAELNKKLDNS